MARRTRRQAWSARARRWRNDVARVLAQAVDWRIGAAAVVAFALGLGVGIGLAPEGGDRQQVAGLTPVPPPLPSRPAPSSGPAPRREPPPEAIAPSAGPPAAAHAPARPPRAAPRTDPRSDLAPWRRYAVSAPNRAGRAAVAIVIDDLGLDRPRTARTVALPGPLTLSFLPYAGELAQQTEAGRRAGHELMLHLPMEAESRRISPGPNALRTGLEPTELLDLLAWNLGRFEGYVGVNNHMGSRFTADAGAMRTVLVELERRGLMFLDSRTSSHTVGYRLGAELGLPVAQRDIFLDNVLTADRVNDQLAEVERVAKRHGQAIAIGHPHDATLEALTDWLPHLEARGLVLVPITALARAPQQAQARW